MNSPVGMINRIICMEFNTSEPRTIRRWKQSSISRLEVWKDDNTLKWLITNSTYGKCAQWWPMHLMASLLLKRFIITDHVAFCLGSVGSHKLSSSYKTPSKDRWVKGKLGWAGQITRSHVYVEGICIKGTGTWGKAELSKGRAR